MSKPLCGEIYELTVPGASATHALVLTEDLWNAQMGDSVVVPLYGPSDANTSLLFVAVDDELRADCTRVQSMAHEFIGDWAAPCADEPWTRVRIGVRTFLDIDRRIHQTPQPPVPVRRGDWWPRQNTIHFARNPAIQTTDKLYASVSDDDWNVQPEAATVAAVRLTSKSKSQRLRWEVPVGNGYVVAGDIYSVRIADFDRSVPRKPYPTRMTDDESAAVAEKQKSILTLR